MGYCPQIDPLIEWMNSRETLLFYGRLKGLPKAGLDKTVEDLIVQVSARKVDVKKPAPCLNSKLVHLYKHFRWASRNMHTSLADLTPVGINGSYLFV